MIRLNRQALTSGKRQCTDGQTIALPARCCLCVSAGILTHEDNPKHSLPVLPVVECLASFTVAGTVVDFESNSSPHSLYLDIWQGKARR